MKKFLTLIFEKVAEKLREKEPKMTVLEAENGENDTQSKAKKIIKKRKQKGRENIDSVNLPQKSQELLPLISTQKKKLISIAGDIGFDPDKA